MVKALHKKFALGSQEHISLLLELKKKREGSRNFSSDTKKSYSNNFFSVLSPSALEGAAKRAELKMSHLSSLH